METSTARLRNLGGLVYMRKVRVKLPGALGPTNVLATAAFKLLDESHFNALIPEGMADNHEMYVVPAMQHKPEDMDPFLVYTLRGKQPVFE